MEAKQTKTQSTEAAANSDVESPVKRPISLGRALRQGDRFLSLARKHQGPLARCGWTAKHSDELGVTLSRLREAAGKASSARRAAMRATGEQRLSMKALRRFRFRLVAGLSLAKARNQTEIDLAKFASASLGRRPGAALAWISEIVGEVEGVETPPRTIVPGGATVLLKESRDRLSTAIDRRQSTQREVVRVARLVAGSRAAIGSMISNIGNAARIAFAAEAEALGEFRLTEKKRTAKKAETAPPDAEKAGQAA